MSSPWGDPRANRREEVVNGHSAPPAPRRAPEPIVPVPLSVAVAAADGVRAARWAPVEQSLRALIAEATGGSQSPGPGSGAMVTMGLPVRILEMQAGTVFTGDWSGIPMRAMRVVEPNEDYPLPYDAVGDDGITYSADEFDPDTIREVSPPPSAGREGDE